MKFTAYDPYIVTAESRAAFRCGSLPGVELTIAPLTTASRGWLAFFNEWRLRRNVDLAALSPEEDDAAVREWAPAIADHGIRGWTGLVGDDGAPVAYSPEVARELAAWLADRSLPDLKRLFSAANSADTFRPAGAPELKPAAEVAGNS